MALTDWGFIYTAAGSAEGGDVSVVDTGKCRTVLVGVERPEEAVEVALRLVGEGVADDRTVRGFRAGVGRACHRGDRGAVPVGTVGYGPEAVDQVHAIFS